MRRGALPLPPFASYGNAFTSNLSKFDLLGEKWLKIHMLRQVLVALEGSKKFTGFYGWNILRKHHFCPVLLRGVTVIAAPQSTYEQRSCPLPPLILGQGVRVFWTALFVNGCQLHWNNSSALDAQNLKFSRLSAKRPKNHFLWQACAKNGRFLFISRCQHT